jgi:group I intron endonuclease
MIIKHIGMRSIYWQKSGIYMLKNNITNDFYIGATINLYARWTNHYRELKNGKHGNTKMRNDALRYGHDVFSCEVLEFCGKEKLSSREQYYLDVLHPTYNKWLVTKIPKGYKHSAESVIKMTKNNGGIKDMEAFRQKHLDLWAKRKLDPNYREKYLKHLDKTGFKFSEESKAKMSKDRTGKKMPESFSKIMRQVRLGTKWDPINKTWIKASEILNKEKE